MLLSPSLLGMGRAFPRPPLYRPTDHVRRPTDFGLPPELTGSSYEQEGRMEANPYPAPELPNPLDELRKRVRGAIDAKSQIQPYEPPLSIMAPKMNLESMLALALVGLADPTKTVVPEFAGGYLQGGQMASQREDARRRGAFESAQQSADIGIAGAQLDYDAAREDQIREDRMAEKAQELKIRMNEAVERATEKRNVGIAGLIGKIQAANLPGEALLAWEELNRIDAPTAMRYKAHAQQIDAANASKFKTEQEGRELTNKKRQQAYEQAEKLFPFKATTEEQKSIISTYAAEIASNDVKMLPTQNELLKARAQIAQVDAQYREWEKITDYNRAMFDSTIALAQLQNSINNYSLNRDEFTYRMTLDSHNNAVRLLEQNRASLNAELDTHEKRLDDLENQRKFISEQVEAESMTAEQAQRAYSHLDKVQGVIRSSRATSLTELQRLTQQIQALQPPTPTVPVGQAPGMPPGMPRVAPPIRSTQGMTGVTLKPDPSAKVVPIDKSAGAAVLPPPMKKIKAPPTKPPVKTKPKPKTAKPAGWG